jgi:uncharacterized protein (TIGR02118 family)
MIVRFSGAPRAAGSSCAEFQAHWRGEHGGLAGQIDGVQGYVQNHAILREGRPLLPWPGFDALAEIEFASLEAMDRGFGSEFYREAVMADERAMVDKTRFSLLLAARRVLVDGEPADDGVKLLSFFPLAAGADRDELAEALAGPYRDALDGVPLVRHEQLLELPGAHAGREPPFCAAADLLWFGNAGAALAFVNSAAGDRARYVLAGLVAGVERLIARPVRIA